jgi:ribonuclease Y
MWLQGLISSMSAGEWAVAAGIGVAGIVLGVLVGQALAARRARGILTRTRQQSDKIVEQAHERAEAEARQRLARAEDEIQDRRQAWEAEEARRKQAIEETARESEQRHRRLIDRDRALTRRDQLIGDREKDLERRLAEAAEQREELDRLQEEVLVRLEEVSGLTRDEARRQIVDALRLEVRQSAARDVRMIKEEMQKSVDQEAATMLALAMERLASDFASERTVSTVPLPNGNFRGRIIGTEGRNIRAFEKLTGMQLVLEEEPPQVVISGFHPIRREIARRSLEKLIEGGTIHPKRIQQVVGQCKRRVEQEMVRAGKEAVGRFQLDDVHPEVVKLLGRLRYRSSYGQNVLDHVCEAAALCGNMAAQLGLDQKLAQRAALLHDIGKAADFEREGTHPEIGSELARKYNEPEVVINAIESHHDDCEVTHPISVLVAASDALSGARPGARRRTTVDYIRRVTRLEEIGSSFDGVSSCYALQAGRELRIIVNARAVDDDQAALMAHDMSQRIQSEVDYPGRIKITVIRELSAKAMTG